MESFQGRAPPTGWNDLPASLSPNLKFGGGSKKRINRNNLYQQYYSNSSLYSSYSSSGSQDYGLNQQNQIGSQNFNPNGPPPMMSSQNSFNQTPSQQPPMMGSQNNLNQTPLQQPPIMGMQQQPPQQTAQAPSVNYFNPSANIPAPTFNNQSYNNTNTYQPNNYAAQAATTPNYGSSSVLNATQSVGNISNDRKMQIMNIYNKHLDTYNASCSLFQRKIYEDSRQRINNMYEQLNNNLIDDQTFAILEAIANALETKDANIASTNVSYLMRNSSEMKWVLGVKELVDFICSN